jgi:hypothetical protein
LIGNQLNFTINPESPLSDLYEKIGQKKMIDSNEIRLLYMAKSLIKHRSANFYQIKNNDTIQMMLNPPSFKFNVKLPDGRIEKTKINCHLKISLLKEKIEKEFQIPFDKQKLFCVADNQEQLLEDENYIGEYRAISHLKVDNFILVKVE